MKHKILIALTLVVFSSCMKLKKKGDEAAPATTPTPVATLQTNAVEELSYQYIPSKQGSANKVEFKVPSYWPTTVLVKRSSKTELEKEIPVPFDQSRIWTDSLTSENKMTYKFYSKNGTDLTLLEEVEVLPVLDLMLTEDLDLVKKFEITSKTKVIYIHYLNLNGQKHLFVEDFSGKIIIEQLESDIGFIQTFPLDEKAEMGHDGKSGGSIEMKIVSGNGNLNIVMKGQDGGTGLQGAAPDATFKGGRGTDGAPAEFIGVPPANRGATKFNCSVSPTNGGPGDQGKKGNRGDVGKNGGNTGTVSIENLASDIQITTKRIVGLKGMGGEGGNGGEGGDPGLGGDGAELDLEKFLNKINRGLDPETTRNVRRFQILGTPCAAASNGRQGNPGNPGNPGDPGIDGIEN